MKMQAKLILAAALAIMVLAPVAADDKISKPRSNEVVLVARFVVSPGLDRDFFAHYANFTAPGVVAKADRKWKGQTPDDVVYLETNEAGKADMWAKRALFGSLGQIGYMKVAIPKKRELQIDGARVYIVDNAFLYFDLPVLRKISVPEGVNYVYLGTFTYTLKDEFLMVSDISKSDEFDTAAEAVKTAFGKDAQLTRVNLLDLEDGATKK